MKLLFLQNIDDSLGGIANVNCSLMKNFIANGEEVFLISMRHLGKNEKISYPEGMRRIVINEQENWGCPRYSAAVAEMRRGKVLTSMQIISARLRYNKSIQKDYQECRKKIIEIQPDIIINSHYELLAAVPEQFLKVTVNHFHTSFDQVLENKSYMKIFREYQQKIAKFVWLSKATAQKAKEAGFDNSTYIYNPLSFTTEKITDSSQKKIIFVGRFSEEKRLDRAVRLFSEVVEENQIKDWTFDIYGTGELGQELTEQINNSAYVSFKGSTDCIRDVLTESSIFMLTSRFEGMALVVLEANECGVPVICFNFGESVHEEIIDNETGFIIEQNDEKTYKQKLRLLMENEELRSRLGRNAKKFVGKFHEQTIIGQWYELFATIKR